VNSMIRLNPANARRRVPMTEHKRVALRAYTALAEMCNGTARRDEWQDLSESVNVVEALSVMGKYDKAVVDPLVSQAIAGLMVAIKCPDGLMSMGAAATLAMRTLVTMHDEAIAKFSVGTMYSAHEMVLAKICDPTANESTGLYVVNA
jgi:hypothetical protein